MSVAVYDNRCDRLIQSIYGTLGTRSLWPGVMEQVCEIFQGGATAFIQHNFGNRTGFIRHHCGHLDISVDNAYATRMCGRNPWLRSDMPYRPGSAFFGTEILPESELVGTEFYQEYLKPLSMMHRLCGVVARDGLDVNFLTVMRGKDERPFDDRDKANLRLLLPHLHQAWDLRECLRAVRSERESLLELLQHIPVACMLVNQGGKVHFLNRSAETLLARRDGLMVRAGRLSTGTNRESVLLRRTIEKVAAGNAESSFGGEQVVLSRPSQRPPLLLTVFLIHRGTMDPRDNTGAMVAVLGKDPDSDDHSTLEGFAAAYHLTQSEARLIGLLADGRRLFEAATDLGVTRNTARTHMRHIYSKVGAHRQTDIIRLLAKLGMS